MLGSTSGPPLYRNHHADRRDEQGFRLSKATHIIHSAVLKQAGSELRSVPLGPGLGDTARESGGEVGGGGGGGGGGGT